MNNPYRPPESRVDQALPGIPRSMRCALAFASGVGWSILIIAMFFVWTIDEPLQVEASRVRYDRVVAISLACGAACAVVVLFFRRFPAWLLLFIGALPMLLLIVASMFS